MLQSKNFCWLHQSTIECGWWHHFWCVEEEARTQKKKNLHLLAFGTRPHTAEYNTQEHLESENAQPQICFPQNPKTMNPSTKCTWDDIECQHSIIKIINNTKTWCSGKLAIVSTEFAFHPQTPEDENRKSGNTTHDELYKAKPTSEEHNMTINTAWPLKRCRQRQSGMSHRPQF